MKNYTKLILMCAAPLFLSAADGPHVYDKAKYHDAVVQKYGLSDEHAANHTIVFLRWLIERHLMSDSFEKTSADILARFRSGKVSIHKVYDWWDRCLVDDQLSQEGNAFAMHYFDFDRGRYIDDYIATLKGKLPTEFHVDYTEENYQKMKRVIDRRYDEWRTSQKK